MKTETRQALHYVDALAEKSTPFTPKRTYRGGTHMWNTMKTQVEGRLRAIRSRWRPIPVRVEQFEINRHRDEALWFDWITRLAKYGMSYEPMWLTVEQRMHELFTTHPETISDTNADSFMGGVDTFEYIHVNGRGGRFLSALVEQFEDPTVVEIGTAFGVSGMYLLATIGEGFLWTFDPCDDWKPFAELSLSTVSSRFSRIPEAFEEGFPKRCAEIEPVDIAFVDGLHTYEHVTREVALLEPMMPAGSIMVLHDVELNDEMKQAWNQIRHSDRVRWSAFAERQFGIFEWGPRR